MHMVKVMRVTSDLKKPLTFSEIDHLGNSYINDAFANDENACIKAHMMAGEICTGMDGIGCYFGVINTIRYQNQ